MKLQGWTYVLTYCKHLDVYAKGSKRIAVCKETGKVILRYSHRSAQAKGAAVNTALPQQLS